MSLFHAIVWIDHHTAQVLQFDATQALEMPVRLRAHCTRQHGSTAARQHGSMVRGEHEFFAEVCDAMQGIAEVVVAGSHTAQADFRRYVEKHRPKVMRRIVGWETVGHLSTKELVARARRYFSTHAGMAEPMKAG